MKKRILITRLSLGLILLLISNLYAQQSDAAGSTGIPSSPEMVGSPRSFDPCTYTQLGNSFENARISMHDVYATPNYSADDIDVPANVCMDIRQVISNHFVASGATPSSVNIYFWTDAGGAPGSLINSYIAVPFSSNLIGTSFSLDVREVTSTLPYTMSLCGGPSGTKYWMSVTTAAGSNSYWELQTIIPYGHVGMNLLPDFGAPAWTSISPENYVFSLKYNYRSQIEDTVTVCINDTVIIDGVKYATSVTAYDTITSSTGCDSVKLIRVLREFGYGGDFEGGRVSMHDVYTNLNQGADDFDVPANQCIVVEGINTHFYTVAPNQISSNNVYFYSDAAGLPGAIYNVQTGLPFTADSINNVMGSYNIYNVNTTILSPVEFCGGPTGTKFWVSVTVASGGLSYWEYQTPSIYGASASFLGPDFGTPVWTSMGSNCVFALDYHYKVDITPPTQTVFCTYHLPTALTATPPGGVFSGPGIISNVFNPGSASIGNNPIVYTYTTPEGCNFTDTLNLTVSNCVGIEDEMDVAFNAFPNPTTGIFNLSAHSGSDLDMNWSIVNMNGQVLMGGVQLMNAGDSNKVIDVSSFSPGVYYLRIQSNEIDRTIRLIKL